MDVNSRLLFSCNCLACVVCLGTNATAYESHQVRERELFAAFNIDTHPAALFRYDLNLICALNS